MDLFSFFLGCGRDKKYLTLGSSNLRREFVITHDILRLKNQYYISVELLFAALD